MAETTQQKNSNKTEHNQPGGVRGTEITEGQQGITTHPQEESARQAKVVHEHEKAEAGR